MKEKNKGGRPPIYDPNDPARVEEYAQRCEDYFEYIKGEIDTTKISIGGSQNWIRPPENPTVTGLTLYLDFCDKSTLYDYAKKDQFSHPTKKALARIEQFHEQRVGGGANCTGNIFILKNFGWKDKVEQEVSLTASINWHEEKTYETPEDEL